MTMPHLSNCVHQGDGWCLDCVKILWEKNEKLEMENKNLKDIICQANKVVGDYIKMNSEEFCNRYG
jgi:hypothetical protein